jgi:hypothetical protein
MATATTVKLATDVGDWPQYYRSGITQEQADKASEVLQRDLEEHHIFFNSAKLHNHVTHHILAVWALNGSTKSIQENYETNAKYQRPLGPVKDDILDDLSDPAGFMKHFNKEAAYHTYLKFFQDEIEKNSWQDVLQKYVFAGDERADAMLVRMFAG